MCPVSAVVLCYIIRLPQNTFLEGCLECCSQPKVKEAGRNRSLKFWTWSHPVYGEVFTRQCYLLAPQPTWKSVFDIPWLPCLGSHLEPVALIYSLQDSLDSRVWTGEWRGTIYLGKQSRIFFFKFTMRAGWGCGSAVQYSPDTHTRPWAQFWVPHNQ